MTKYTSATDALSQADINCSSHTHTHALSLTHTHSDTLTHTPISIMFEKGVLSADLNLKEGAN